MREDEYYNVTPSSKKMKYEPNHFTRNSFPPPSSHSNPSLPMPQTLFQPTSSSSSSAVKLPQLPEELGKCIAHDIALLKKLGWKHFVAASK
jgi:hypothetical protein